MLLNSNSSDQSNFNIEMGTHSIERVSNFRYLGITLQDNLKWTAHIDSTCRKITGVSSIMSRLGSKINHATRISVYYAMVNSHLSYLMPVWSTSATLSDISRLQIVQNYSIRKFFFTEYYLEGLSTSDIMNKYKILNVRQLMQQNNLTMMYKIDKGLMKTNYKLNRTPIHAYTTRNRSMPRLTTYRTNTGKKSIFRSCTECYNLLQPHLKLAPTIHSFKKKLKIQLLSENH